MELSGETLIAAPRPKVWAALNDPGFVEACRRDQLTAAEMELDRNVALSDLEPPSGCTICLPGQAGAAGAAVRLYDADGQTTRLTYQAADDAAAYEVFFTRFAAAVSHGVALPGGPASAEAPLRADGKPAETVLPGLEQTPGPSVPHDPKADVAEAMPYRPPAHEDHDHDPSNPHYFGLPVGVIIAGAVAGVSVCITLVKFLL